MSLIYIKKYQIGGTGLHNISGRNKKTGMPINSNFMLSTNVGNNPYTTLGDSNYNNTFMFTRAINNPNVIRYRGGLYPYLDAGVGIDNTGKLSGKLGLTAQTKPDYPTDAGLTINSDFSKDRFDLNAGLHMGKRKELGRYGSDFKGTLGSYLNVANINKASAGDASLNTGAYGNIGWQPRNSPFSVNLYGNAGLEFNENIANSLGAKPTWNAGLSVTANLNAIRKKVKPQHKAKPQPQGGNWVNERYNF